MTMLRADTIGTQSRGGYNKAAMARHSLLLMLLLPCLAPAEVTSVILMLFFAVWVMLSHWRIKKDLISLTAPIFLLLLIGSLGARQYPLFDVIKDVWYVGKVAVAIGAGYVLARFLHNFAAICKIIVLAGAIAAAIHFVEIAIHLRSGTSFFDLRHDEGVKGFFITVIGLALMSSIPRRAFGFDSIHYYVIGLVSMGSLIASFSRTLIVSYIVMVVVLRGWTTFSVRNFIRVTAVSVAFGLVVLILAQLDTSGEKSLASKFISAGSEVSVQNYEDMRDINLNWRGFESYRALLDFQEGSTFQQIFGQGLGATVDLGFYMHLGGATFRYIPVLHNGYMYVLVKFGVVGVLVYLNFVLRAIRAISYMRGLHALALDDLRTRRLIAAIGWSLLLTTFVIAGPFNKLTLVPALVLLGLLVGVRNLHLYSRSDL